MSPDSAAISTKRMAGASAMRIAPRRRIAAAATRGAISAGSDPAESLGRLLRDGGVAATGGGAQLLDGGGDVALCGQGVAETQPEASEIGAELEGAAIGADGIGEA